MAGKHIGYARLSTNEQNLERQMQLLREAGCEKIFTDKDSGRQMKRKGWEDAKAFLREEDTLFIHDLNRLGRSMEGNQTGMGSLNEDESAYCGAEHADFRHPEVRRNGNRGADGDEPLKRSVCMDGRRTMEATERSPRSGHSDCKSTRQV